MTRLLLRKVARVRSMLSWARRPSLVVVSGQQPEWWHLLFTGVTLSLYSASPLLSFTLVTLKRSSLGWPAKVVTGGLYSLSHFHTFKLSHFHWWSSLQSHFCCFCHTSAFISHPSRFCAFQPALACIWFNQYEYSTLCDTKLITMDGWQNWKDKLHLKKE